MPRSRGSDASQRQSPRVPLHLKSTASSEANAVRRPTGKERSPKVSPRGGVSQEGKRGTKLVDLETRLSKVQEELKKLRNRLASAEVAKIEAEQALVTAKKRIPAASSAPKELGEEDERPPPPRDAAEEDNRGQESKSEGEAATSPETMDVFEVVIPAESVPEEMKTMVAKEAVDEDGKEKEEKKGDALVEDLKTKLLEKEKEVEILLEENMIFKTHAAEEAKRIASAAEEAETELRAKLSSMKEEMEESKARARRMAEQLEAAEGAKTALEEEMKRLRVQTEQWRKAAEAAAAAVLADDDDDEVDKHIAAWASPLAMEEGDWRRRKGAGIRMFWKKKKGQQK
ncbi:interactor of constitutive active ROPs 4-like [Curcuma longa]|uniref:interactor of constitutive active ROPs 4-like n=1 Tax=Curcuma longa TaxID=136217 RepID=UPI003D9EE961